MKRLFFALALLAPLAAFGAAGINFTNTVPNLLVRTNATIRSGLPDNPANVAMIVDTVGSWSDDLPLISLNNHGTNVATIYAGGGYNAGRGQSAIYGPYPQGLFITTTTDLDGITANYFSFEHTDSTDENSFGIIRGNMETNSAEFSIETRDVYRIISDWTMSGVTPSCDWSVKVNGTEVTHFDPLAIVGSSAYTLNTIDPTASGPPDYLLRVQLTNSNRLTVDSAGNVSAAGQMGFTGFTTANLPAGVAVGYQTYCTDCLTPWGTGDRVEWDGSSWKTLRARITATTNTFQYMLNALGSAWVGTTTNTNVRLFNTPALDVFGSAQQTGTGADATAFLSLAGLQAWNITTGTTTNGSAGFRGALWTPNAGEYIEAAFSIAPGTLVSAAEAYYILVGLNSGASGFGTDGVFFLYDPYNCTAHGLTGAQTNDWLCFSRSNSVNYATTDSTLTVATSPYVNLSVVVAGTSSAEFYANGALVATVTNLPTAALYSPCVRIVKSGGSTGTTSRNVKVQWGYHHLRWATVHNFFP